MSDKRLDLDFCRSFFPPLANGEVYFENAGGSYVPQQVIDAMEGYMRECQCQPGWRFASSQSARARLDRAQNLMAEAINADRDEIVVGPSTTLNVYVLAHAWHRCSSRAARSLLATRITNPTVVPGGAWRMPAW
ncbi:MAG: aminotransferase class V-fold PLP-dependent enzyme [Lysobacterales bacterium]|nr:MAG: aminotransferase class V-fold PLP-dependent enzyme [Xanthomonadales bacterium]